MKHHALLVAMAVAALAAGCRTKDVKTAVITVPGMQCEQCAQTIRRALVTLNGGMGVEYEEKRKGESAAAPLIAFDFEKHTVTVTYDSMLLGLKNLEFAIAEAGYDVVAQPYDIPADRAARARLPAVCQTHGPADAPPKSGPASPAVPAQAK